MALGPILELYEVTSGHRQVAVRSKPSLQAEVIGRKVCGEMIEVLGFDSCKTWARVTHCLGSTKVEGWMALVLAEFGQLLRPIPDIRPDASPEEQLLLAVRRGTYPEIRRLIREGADPNAADAQGETPLFEAASMGSLDAAAVLLCKRADINACSASGSKAVDFAADKGMQALLSAAAGRQVDLTQLTSSVDALAECLQHDTRDLLARARGDWHTAHPWPQRCGAFSAQLVQSSTFARADIESHPEISAEDDASVPRPAIPAVANASPHDGDDKLLYEVMHGPMVAVRAEPHFASATLGAKKQGLIVEVLDVRAGAAESWVQVLHRVSGDVAKGWMALSAPRYGILLRRARTGAEPTPV